MRRLRMTYQLLNCGRAQARKRKRRPMEPLKAKATRAGKEIISVDFVGFLISCLKTNLKS